MFRILSFYVKNICTSDFFSYFKCLVKKLVFPDLDQPEKYNSTKIQWKYVANILLYYFLFERDKLRHQYLR